ncbi:MAG TPA: trypsin-like serine protease [Candidatus Limnocylindria bacterium]|nr:trypsin-like serine protease [Candidatus Limnocylindria bacterium]
MLRKLALLVALVFAFSTGATAPASAVTDGELDGNGHPYVGLMVAKDAKGSPLWRCSGTLISPTVYLTAGHCTESPAASAEIWFDSDLEPEIRAGTSGYPFKGEVSGTTYTHPEYRPNQFYYRDLGIVVLKKPVKLGKYGALPQLDQLDALRPGEGTRFTTVGYGLQKSFPDAASWKESRLRTRMVAYPYLVQINGGLVGDFSLLLSNNANSGGTCFGDSGGPNFVGSSNVVGGVTSFGLNGNCAGTGGVFRVDRYWSLDWVRTFLD